MLRYTGTLLAVLLLLTAVGCGDSHDKVLGDMATSMEDLGSALEEVKDVDSAEANADRIADIAGDMQEISKRAEALEKPSEETVKELKAKYEDRFDEAGKKLFGEMLRVMMLGDEVKAVLDDAFNKVEKDDVDMPDWFN